MFWFTTHGKRRWRQKCYISNLSYLKESLMSFKINCQGVCFPPQQRKENWKFCGGFETHTGCIVCQRENTYSSHSYDLPEHWSLHSGSHKHHSIGFKLMLCSRLSQLILTCTCFLFSLQDRRSTRAPMKTKYLTKLHVVSALRCIVANLLWVILHPDTLMTNQMVKCHKWLTVTNCLNLWHLLTRQHLLYTHPLLDWTWHHCLFFLWRQHLQCLSPWMIMSGMTQSLWLLLEKGRNLLM